MVRQRGTLVFGAGAAIATSFFIVRRFAPSNRLNRIINDNLSLFPNSHERRTIKTLASSKHKKYLLQGWPRPGINDAAKRDLITKASSGSPLPDLESTRLSLLTPPLCDHRPTTLEHHGDTRVDDFYWLRDDDRKNPDVLAHLEAENSYTKTVLADTEALQETLYKEMRGRIQEADQSAPMRAKGYWYYTRTEEGAQYAVHCRRPLPDSLKDTTPVETDTMDVNASSEEVLLDENEEAKGHAFYMVGGCDTSPNHKYLAYAVDTVGNEMYTLYVKDLATGKQVLKKPIADTAGDFAWAADNKTLFYVVKDSLDRPYKVFRHEVGSSQDDELVYHEEDEAFYLGIGLSRSEKVIYIHSGSAVTSYVLILSSDEPRGEWRVVLPRTDNVEYSVEDRGDELFITVRDEARPNSEVLIAPRDDPSNATVLIPHRHDVKIEHIEVSSDYLVSFERRQGLQQAVVYKLPENGAPVSTDTLPFTMDQGHPIAFEEPAYELSAGAQGDFDSPVLRFHYTSLTTPDTIIDYNMASGQRAVKKVQPVLGGFDQTKYKTERLWATADDGALVPISLVYRTDIARLDGTDPMLLDAYGSYEIPNDADFRSTRLSLIDRGFIFAIAHVRGGGEMGRFWYEDGKFLKKKNTFTDFISCAKLLIDKKYVSPQKLCIQGRSAGGLTMGAVVNLAPELFNAVILGVPFVDCLTTMLDPTIPLTVIEHEEWGNPIESKEFYECMKSYSPVDNLRPGVEYPHMFVTCGLHDPRVGYWEPAKFVAKLRHFYNNENKNNNSNNLQTRKGLLLLKCEMGAGHFSQSGRFDRLKEVAQEHAFLLKCCGMLDAQLIPSSTPETVSM